MNPSAEAAVVKISDDPGDFGVCMKAANAICRIRERTACGLHWKEITADQIITEYVTVRYPINVQQKKWQLLVTAATKIADRYSPG